MPTLPGANFTAQIGERIVSGGRRASGEDFGGGFSEIGRDLQTAADRFLTDQEENESRKAVVRSAEIKADYARKLDEASKTGADLTQLRESMNKELADISKDFVTKRGVDNTRLYTANTNIMFDEQANRINVHRAVTDAQTQASTMSQRLAQQVYVAPTTLKDAEGTVDSFLETYAGKIPPETLKQMAERMKLPLNVTAASSVIRANPDEGERMLRSGVWSLTGDEIKQLTSEAQTVRNFNRVSKEHEQAEIIRKERRASDEKESQLFSQLSEGKLTGKAFADAVLSAPEFNADPGAKMRLMQAQKAMIVFAERHSDRPPRDDPSVMLNLVTKALRGELTNEGAIAHAGKGVNTPNSLAFLANLGRQGMDDKWQENYGQRVNSLVGRVRNQITADMTIPNYSDASGFNPKAYAESVAVQEISRMITRAKGDPDKMASLFDPKNLNSPLHPEFYGQIRQTVRQETDRLQMLSLPDVRDLGLDGMLAKAKRGELKPGMAFVDPTGTKRDWSKDFEKAFREKLDYERTLERQNRDTEARNAAAARQRLRAPTDRADLPFAQGTIK